MSSSDVVSIHGALRSAIVAFGTLPEGTVEDPYVTDAKSFVTQANVCLEKHMLTRGIEIPPDPNAPKEVPPPESLDAPPALSPQDPQSLIKESLRDRDKTA